MLIRFKKHEFFVCLADGVDNFFVFGSFFLDGLKITFLFDRFDWCGLIVHRLSILLEMGDRAHDCARFSSRVVWSTT